MTTRIKVGIRLRPFLQWEANKGYENSKIQVDYETNEIKVLEDNKKAKKTFKFDHVFGEEADQNSVYNGSNVDSLLKKAVEGYHCTLFAYGQTGSGKTYTMEGYEYGVENSYEDGAMPKPKMRQDTTRFGIVPRAVSRLFDMMKERAKSVDYNISCSFLQIYNEKVYDLLNPSTMRAKGGDGQISLSPGLRLRWTAQEQFQVENLFVCECNNAEEVMSYYNYGIRNRITASHKLNMASSRSHTILTLRIESIDRETNNSTFSRIQLVDLAGSERIGQTGTEGKLAKESIDINKSLFILRQVITTLSEVHRAQKGKDNNSNIPHIPYRESKLTSLLKQSIGGNSYSLMLACINPCDEFIDENLSTLNYATKATYIKNEPVLNNDPKAQIIHNLKTDVKHLRLELDRANEHIALLSNLAGSQQNGITYPHPPQCCSTQCKYLGGGDVSGLDDRDPTEGSIQQDRQARNEDLDRFSSPSSKLEKRSSSQLHGSDNKNTRAQLQQQQQQQQPTVSETATNFASLNSVFLNSPGLNKISMLQQQAKRFENRQQQDRNLQGNYDSFSEQLLESIAMVRDLLANNKELRESTDLAMKKVEICERDLFFLQRENQELRDKQSSTTSISKADTKYIGTDDESKQALSSTQISNWSRFSKQDIIQEVLTLRQEKRALERKIFGNEIEQQIINNREPSGFKSLNSSPNNKQQQKVLENSKKITLQPVNSTQASPNRKQTKAQNLNSFTVDLSSQDALTGTNFGRNPVNLARQQLAQNSPMNDSSSQNGYTSYDVEGLKPVSPPKRRAQAHNNFPMEAGEDFNMYSRHQSLGHTQSYNNRSSNVKQQNQNQQVWYPHQQQLQNYNQNNIRQNKLNQSYQQ